MSRATCYTPLPPALAGEGGCSEVGPVVKRPYRASDGRSECLPASSTARRSTGCCHAAEEFRCCSRSSADDEDERCLTWMCCIFMKRPSTGRFATDHSPPLSLFLLEHELSAGASMNCWVPPGLGEPCQQVWVVKCQAAPRRRSMELNSAAQHHHRIQKCYRHGDVFELETFRKR